MGIFHLLLYEIPLKPSTQNLTLSSCYTLMVKKASIVYIISWISERNLIHKWAFYDSLLYHWKPRLGAMLFHSTLRLVTGTSRLMVSTDLKIRQHFAPLTLFPLICLALCIQDSPTSTNTPCLAIIHLLLMSTTWGNFCFFASTTGSDLTGI